MALTQRVCSEWRLLLAINYFSKYSSKSAFSGDSKSPVAETARSHAGSSHSNQMSRSSSSASGGKSVHCAVPPTSTSAVWANAVTPANSTRVNTHDSDSGNHIIGDHTAAARSHVGNGSHWQSHAAAQSGPSARMVGVLRGEWSASAEDAWEREKTGWYAGEREQRDKGSKVRDDKILRTIIPKDVGGQGGGDARRAGAIAGMPRGGAYGLSAGVSGGVGSPGLPAAARIILSAGDPQPGSGSSSRKMLS